MPITSRSYSPLSAILQIVSRTWPSSTLVSRPATRRVRHFKVPTRVEFYLDEANYRSILELYTTDEPGLLSVVGQLFESCAVSVQNAKIATFGSQAEDVFYVTGAERGPLSEGGQNCLRKALIETLDGDE